MTQTLSTYFERLQDFGPALLASLGETGLMILFAIIAALILGLPIGTLLFLTNKGRWMENKTIYKLVNGLINIIRSFPFMLLVIALQPLTRMIYGRATGSAAAASFPLMIIAIAVYARAVEQSLISVPKEITETAFAMGANVKQYVTKFLYVEARSSLVSGFASSLIALISFSTVLGVVGGGGIGDFAIRYGYQRYETDMMYTAIIIILIIVSLIHWLGTSISSRLDKR